MKIRSKRSALIILVLFLLVIVMLLPQHFVMPVQGADRNSFNAKSFWYYPWGKSGTHKGVDIFAKEGTNVNASTSGLVLFTGELGLGGKVVLIIGPKWRLHYYAHLNSINTSIFSWASRNEKIGSVGTTGNAKGKSPHLHYSIISLIPYVLRIDDSKQGWKKIFYLNPIDYIN